MKTTITCMILLLAALLLGGSCTGRADTASEADAPVDTLATPEAKVAACTFFRMALNDNTLASVPLEPYEAACFQRITGLDTNYFHPSACARQIMSHALPDGCTLKAYQVVLDEGSQAEQYLAVYGSDNRLADAMMIGYWHDFQDVLKMPNDSVAIQPSYADDLFCTVNSGDTITIERHIWYTLNDDNEQISGKSTSLYKVDADGHLRYIGTSRQNMPGMNAVALEIMALRQAALSTPGLGDLWEKLESAAMSATPTAADYRVWYGRYRMKAKG